MLRITMLKIIQGIHDSEDIMYFEHDGYGPKYYDYTLLNDWLWENNNETLMLRFRAEGDPKLFGCKEQDGKIIIVSKNTGKELFSHAHGYGE